MALCVFSASLAGIFNGFANPVALAAIGWKYCIVFVAVLVVAILTIYFAYPENKGYSLEEMKIVLKDEDGSLQVNEGNVENAPELTKATFDSDVKKL